MGRGPGSEPVDRLIKICSAQTNIVVCVTGQTVVYAKQDRPMSSWETLLWRNMTSVRLLFKTRAPFV